ncbi:rhodanese-like domain-containing protein [Gangjinia marincola]
MNILIDSLNKESVPYISAEELEWRLASENIVLLDTRSKAEYDVSHIATAIYVGEKPSEEIIRNLPKNPEAIILYCSLGVRSEDVGEQLLDMEIENVYNLYGGIFHWKNQGKTVVSPSGEATEKVHAYSKIWGVWLKNAEKVY